MFCSKLNLKTALLIFLIFFSIGFLLGLIIFYLSLKKLFVFKPKSNKIEAHIENQEELKESVKIEKNEEIVNDQVSVKLEQESTQEDLDDAISIQTKKFQDRKKSSTESQYKMDYSKVEPKYMDMILESKSPVFTNYLQKSQMPFLGYVPSSNCDSSETSFKSSNQVKISNSKFKDKKKY